MTTFVDGYLRVLACLTERDAVNKPSTDRQIAFFRLLEPKSRGHLEEGKYPPYHLVRAASREVGVPLEQAKHWLHAFLFWREHAS